MYQIFNEDCLEGMKRIETGAVDMILTDLPYCVTEWAWDKFIDIQLMWEQFRRVIKDCRAIVLFGQEPFSSKLRVSAPDIYRYDWIWRKSRVGNILNASVCPLRVFENIMVFSSGTTSTNGKKQMLYNPQGLKPYGKKSKSSTMFIHHFGRVEDNRENYVAREYVQKYTNFPQSILEFKSPSRPVHPTQKPVDLLEYLIRTYTNECELVLDATMGSGSTGVAAINTNRRFIGFETEQKFYDIARRRIDEAIAQREQSLFKLEA